MTDQRSLTFNFDSWLCSSRCFAVMAAVIVITVLRMNGEICGTKTRWWWVHFSYLLWWQFLWTQWHHYEPRGDNNTNSQTSWKQMIQTFQIWLSINTFLKIVTNECTLTMNSSTVTEPVSGCLGWVFVSKATEQGLNTYWTELDWWIREVKTCWCRHLQIRSVSAEEESL